MNLRIFAALVVAPALGFGAAQAATFRITPEDAFHEIMASAAYGDTVMVAPGTYSKTVMYSGIHLMSESGPSETIFTNYENWCIKAEGVDSLAVIEGFTLDGSRAAEGVIYCENSKLTIRNCVIQNGWSGVRSMFSDIRVENCKITDCQNGVYFYESAGTVSSNDISGCINGVSLVSSNTIVVRNNIHGNSLGIVVSKHSEPAIGGTLASANRVYGNPGGGLKNDANLKQSGIRTLKPKLLELGYNYWGTDCPDSLLFRGGPVVFKPWVDETGKQALSECTASGKASGK
jgi:parallel beta-helix repeat protein